MTLPLRRPRTIRAQLIVLLLAALAVVQCLSVWLFFAERENTIRATLARDGASRVLTVARALESAAPEAQSGVLRAAESQEFRLGVGDSALSDSPRSERDAFLIEQIAAALAAPPERALGIALYRPDEPLPRNSDFSEEYYDVDPLELVASVVMRDGRWLNARIDIGGPPLRWAWPALLSALSTSAAVIAVVWFVVGRISRPLSLLADNAARLGRGEDLRPTTGSGPLEVERLAAAFDEMAQRLTRLLGERATMLAALGHDLRSPITAMRLRSEMVDDDETRERLNACLDEMQVLVQSALTLARGADTGEPVTPVDLGAMLGELAAELGEAGGTASLAVLAEGTVAARRNSLKRAVRNVAENAIRYGGEARITLDIDGGNALIVVEDDGPGIPPGERERVFDPFVRLEASRSRDTGGSGLGLTIARAAIEAANGTITIEDADSTGSKVVIRFALRDNPPTFSEQV